MNNDDERDHAEEAANQRLLDEQRMELDALTPRELAAIDQFSAHLDRVVSAVADHLDGGCTTTACVGKRAADMLDDLCEHQGPALLDLAVIRLANIKRGAR